MTGKRKMRVKCNLGTYVLLYFIYFQLPKNKVKIPYFLCKKYTNLKEGRH